MAAKRHKRRKNRKNNELATDPHGLTQTFVRRTSPDKNSHRFAKEKAEGRSDPQIPQNKKNGLTPQLNKSKNKFNRVNKGAKVKDRGQRSEVRGQRSEVSGRKPEDRRQKTEEMHILFAVSALSKKEKHPLDIPDLKTTLLYAEQDIKDRWKWYRDRYKRRIRK